MIYRIFPDVLHDHSRLESINELNQHKINRSNTRIISSSQIERDEKYSHSNNSKPPSRVSNYISHENNHTEKKGDDVMESVI
jgi:hypothetical protein